MTYRVGVRSRFSARHRLVGADFGAEGEPHAHDYLAEVVVEGDELGDHAFLVDIVALRAAVGVVTERFAGRMLNDDPEVGVGNPSVEAFARVFCEAVAARLDVPLAVTVTLWESDDAWASFRSDPRCCDWASSPPTL